jgi:WD40 repeat protein
LISEADTIVFLLSPHSIASEVCAWEVEYARSLNKRIAPIVIDEVETGDIPPDLARLNFIFCTERDRFQDAIDSLVSALGTDIEWVREHTRLAALAQRWSGAGESGRLLLRGQDISDAETWRDNHPDEAPQVTASQAAFIGASRTAAIKRQRIVLVGSIVGLVLALGLAGFAYLQRETAIENAQKALEAQNQAIQQRDAAQTNQSLMLTGFAEDKLKNWAPVEAALLSLEAMPDKRSTEALMRDRPLVGEASVMLRKAREQIVEKDILLAVSGSSATRSLKMTISADERWVVVLSGSPNALFIIDLTGEYALRTLDESTFPHCNGELSINTTSTLIAAACGKGIVKLIPLKEGPPIKTLTVGEEWLSVVHLVNAGRDVVTRDRPGTIQVTDIETGSVTFSEIGSALAISPNGEQFAIYSDKRIKIYDAKTKALLGESKPGLTETNNGFSAVRLTFSQGSKWIGLATENQTFVFDGTSAKFRGSTKAQDQSILAAGFGPNGDWHYVTNAKGQADVFDMNSLKLVSSLKKQSGWIQDADISDDRSAMLTSMSSGWMQLWSLDDKKVMAYLGGPLRMVLKARFIHGGAEAISLSDDGTVRRWSLDKWIGQTTPDKSTTVVKGFSGEAVYSPDRKTMALTEAGIFNTESGDRIVLPELENSNPKYRRFDASGETLLATVPRTDSETQFDACLFDMLGKSSPRCFLNRSQTDVVEVDMDNMANTVLMTEFIDSVNYHFTVDTKTGEELGRKAFDRYDRMSQPTLSANGEFLFLLEKEQFIRVFDRTLTKQVATFGPDEDGARIAYSPDRKKLIFYWAVKGKAELWDTANYERSLTFDLRHSSISQLKFSPSGRYVVSRHTATELGIYRTVDGTLASTIEIRGQEWLDNPVFSADEQFVTADAGDQLRVWDVETGRQVVEHKIDPQGNAAMLFGKAFVDNDNGLVAWSWHGPKKWELLTDSQLVVEAVQEQTPRCLSQTQRRMFFLPPTPPRWCITGPGLETEKEPSKWQPKWPYHTVEWRDWLMSSDLGENPPMPQ